MTTDIERELLRAGQPDLPPDLRQRVLATTGAMVQPHVNRLDAIWFSPRWRLAAVLVFFGVLAVDRLSRPTGEVSSQAGGLPVRSSVAMAVQAATDAGLGKADVAAIAAQAASLSLTSEVDAARGVRMDITGVYR